MEESGGAAAVTTLVGTSQQPVAWRLEVEAGRSLAGKLTPPRPLFTFTLETTDGPRTFECDYAALSQLRKELESSLQVLQAGARLTGSTGGVTKKS